MQEKNSKNVKTKYVAATMQVKQKFYICNFQRKRKRMLRHCNGGSGPLYGGNSNWEKKHNTHKTPNKIMNRKKKKKKKMNIEAENTNIVLYRQVA